MISVKLTKQNGLKHWKLALLYRKQILWGIKDKILNYFRVDTKEKLSGKTVKADSQTMISKLDPNEKIDGRKTFKVVA
ncbi:hypothetical protein [Paenibacillus sp. yr247]|uniref:hypothetical protein n=1 Tax=Paenibacillus sp. yr247 TaxID=1761880 RepID=UPI000B88CAA0|nr:hypothetical protein [Paenibacillus sp. yr247]